MERISTWRLWTSLNNTRWTAEELTMFHNGQELAIRVYCLHKDDFCGDIGNVLPFYTAVKQVDNTRDDLPISRTYLYDINILIGFTPSHFLRCSFIQIENAAFTTLLMALLQRYLYLPWTMKHSIKHSPNGQMMTTNMNHNLIIFYRYNKTLQKTMTAITTNDTAVP